MFIAALFFKIPNFSPLLAGEIVLAGVTGVIGYIFFYRGFGKGNVSVVAPITASWSVITVLLAAFLFAEALTPLQIVGVIAVFIGVFFASTNFAELKKSIKMGGWSAGATDAAVAMIAWGISYALLKPITSAVGPIMALFLLKITRSRNPFLVDRRYQNQGFVSSQNDFPFSRSGGAAGFFRLPSF